MKILTIFILVLFFAFNDFSQKFSGTYTAYNPANGVKVELALNQNNNKSAAGKLFLNDNDTYDINRKIEGDYGEYWLQGTISKGNENSFFEAYLEGNQLIFNWIPVDVSNQPDYNSAIEVVLNEKDSSDMNNDSYTINEEKINSNKKDYNMNNQNYQRDPALVGLWHYSDSYTSGDFSMVSEKYMEVRRDGTYSYGNGRIAGGGNSGTFDSGGGGDVINGKWRTENGMIYIDEGGYGNWIPYAGYYVEGNKLLIKFSNGSREIWSRR